MNWTFWRREQRQPQALASTPKRATKVTAVTLMGAAAALTANALLDRWEGNELKPYQDIVKVWTNCRGNTKNVDPRKVMTEAECAEINDEQLVAHAKMAIECVPALSRNHPYQLAAASSLTYNIGGGAFCRSTVAKRFNQGRWREGCDAFLMWNRAGSKVVKGLTRRREAERQICLRGLA